MTVGGRPPGKLPTLTEVVAPGPVAPKAAAVPGETELTARVMARVQRQVDAMLEQRLRQALSPALARFTDALLREARAQLAESLREVVSQAVAQELSRHRDL